MDLWGVTALYVEVSAGKVKLWDMLPTSSLALSHQQFLLLRLDAPQNFLHTLLNGTGLSRTPKYP